MQIAQSKMVKNFVYPFPMGPATFHPIMVLGLGHMYKHQRTGLGLCFHSDGVWNWDLWKQTLRWKVACWQFTGGRGGRCSQDPRKRGPQDRAEGETSQQSGGNTDSGDLLGSAKTGWACRSCPKLRDKARPFNPLSASYIPWIRHFFMVKSNSHLVTMLGARSSQYPQQLGMHQFSRGI